MAIWAVVSCLFKSTWTGRNWVVMISPMCVMSSLLIFSEGKHHWSHWSNWQFQEMQFEHGRRTEQCQCLGMRLGKGRWGDRTSHLTHEPGAKLFAEEKLLYACWLLLWVELTLFFVTWHSLSLPGQVIFGEQFGVAVCLSLHTVLPAGGTELLCPPVAALFALVFWGLGIS